VTDSNPGFFDVVTRQRAYRAFADAPLSDDDVAAVLTAATYAPSAENKQPWEFIVVRDADARATIGELTRRAWETAGRAFSEGRLSPKTFADVDQGATGGIAAAPVLVVVCADNERGLEQTVPSSIFPAIQNLLLAATARGLGSALTTITIGYRAELAELLALPPHVVPVAVVPLGHPGRPLGPPKRDPFANHTHRERYGVPWSARA
jgi:nitroreductase